MITEPRPATMDLLVRCPGTNCNQPIRKGELVTFNDVGWPMLDLPATGPKACIWHASCSDLEELL